MAFLRLMMLALCFVQFGSCDKKWLDPFDMEGDQLSDTPTEAPIRATRQEDVQTEPPKSSEASSDKSNKQMEMLDEPNEVDSKYFSKMYNQLILSLWNRISETSERYKTESMKVDIVVDERAKHVISNYLKQNPEKLTADVNEAFTSLFRNYRPQSHDESITVLWTKDYVDGLLLLMLVLVITLFGASVWFCLMKRWLRLIWPVFYISWIWTWIFLYKKEIAKRHALLLSRGNHACSGPVNVPWYLTLGRYLHSYISVKDDECEVLQEVYSVDPWLEVHPFMALSQMIIMTLVKPAATIGESIAKFVRVIAKDLPMWWAAGVFAVVVLLIIILLLCLFNYRFRIPFLCAIEPSPKPEIGFDNEAISSTLKILDRRTSEITEKLTILDSPQRSSRIERKSSMDLIRSDISRRIRRPLSLKPKMDSRGDTEIDSESDCADNSIGSQPRPNLRRHHSLGDFGRSEC